MLSFNFIFVQHQNFTPFIIVFDLIALLLNGSLFEKYGLLISNVMGSVIYHQLYISLHPL